MERKLVKQGVNTLTVTLPAKWVQKNNLLPGDVIQLTQEENKITITSNKEQKEKRIEKALPNNEIKYIWHNIIGHYIQGYDYIHFTYQASEFKYEHILPGFLLEKQTRTEIILRSIVKQPEEQDNLRRILHLFVEHAQLLEQGKSVQEIKEHESILDQQINYALRLLNKYNKERYQQFLILNTIELASDQLTLIGKHLQEKKRAQELSNITKEFVTYFLKKDSKNLYTVLRSAKKENKKKDFVDGLIYTYIEILYDNIGFLV